MLLFGIFGVLAIAIAATGIYGLLAQQVEERAQEIGLRMALGAVPVDILALVVGRAVRYFIVTLGLVGAWSQARFVEAFLFGVRPYGVTVCSRRFDPPAGRADRGGRSGAARRAMRLDPATALKAAG